MSACVNSRGWQVTGVVLTFLLVAVLHRRAMACGSKRRATACVNGLFWWDLLRTLPRDPVEFAVRYYARYPVNRSGNISSVFLHF